MMDIIDEKGARHTHCHGVPAKEWWATIQLAISHLTNPDKRAKMGISKIVPDSSHTCDDPDCNRLNRREMSSGRAMARYAILQNIAPVRPSKPTNDRERRICEGHPYLAGMYLCEKCARVATAKRLIDAQREMVMSPGIITPSDQT